MNDWLAGWLAGVDRSRAKTEEGPSQLDDFATKANEVLLGAAVSAASFLARAGAKAAEHVPQLSEEEKNKKMSLGGRAALATAGSVASVAAFAAGGSVAKGAKVAKATKTAHDLTSGKAQPGGKVGVAMSAAKKSGLTGGAEAQELKRASSGTASKLFASLSEAADIVAAGANKGVADAVEARYGEDVAKRISEALPGDKEQAVVLPTVVAASADSEPEPEPEPEQEQGQGQGQEQESAAELEPEPAPSPEPEPEVEVEPESKAHQQMATLTAAVALRTGRGDPENDAETLFRRCSWCSEHTTHTIKTRNKLRRSIYTCTACSKDTLACKSCDKSHPNIDLGMAKETAMYSFDQCAVCKGDIKAWPNDVITRRCSWCLQCTQHALKTRNKVRQRTLLYRPLI